MLESDNGINADPLKASPMKGSAHRRSFSYSSRTSSEELSTFTSNHNNKIRTTSLAASPPIATVPERSFPFQILKAFRRSLSYSSNLVGLGKERDLNRLRRRSSLAGDDDCMLFIFIFFFK